jgi:hypothetical protein
LVAGHRCEFSADLVSASGRPFDGDRCRKTTDLEVHHSNYSRFGHERDEDLEVLCKLHHLVRHVRNAECRVCHTWFFEDDVEPLELVKAAVKGNDSNIGGLSAEEIVESAGYLEDGLCGSCASKRAQD